MQKLTRAQFWSAMATAVERASPHEYLSNSFIAAVVGAGLPSHKPKWRNGIHTYPIYRAIYEGRRPEVSAIKQVAQVEQAWDWYDKNH